MRFLVLGYFGYETNQLDGQTVKTRNIYEMLVNHSIDISYFDSQKIHVSKVYTLEMLYKIFLSRFIIIIPAHNMLKWVFPVVYVLSKFFRKKVILIPVGGWLSSFLKNRRVLQQMISKIQAVFPQTKEEVRKLHDLYGWNNIEYLPNFRICNKTKVDFSLNKELKLVFFARINKMKGLDVVFNIADKLGKAKLNMTIDFYGPIYEPDNAYFENEISQHPNTIYKGVLQPDQIQNVLKQYDILLFPTKYKTEGFPGTILDAYMSGVPVIVSNWNHAKEFVKEGYSGFICETEDAEAYYNKVLYLNNNRDVLMRMKANSYNESKKYSDNEAFEIMRKYLA